MIKSIYHRLAFDCINVVSHSRKKFVLSLESEDLSFGPCYHIKSYSSKVLLNTFVKLEVTVRSGSFISLTFVS